MAKQKAGAAVPSVDVGVMLGIAKGVKDAVSGSLERSLRALPSETFDAGVIDRSRTAYAALKASAETYDRLAASEGEAQVPLDVAQRAAEQRGRMFQYLEYELGDDAEIAAELAEIRSGTGHADLSSDLTRLAGLVEENAGVLGSSSRFRTGDANTARELAEAITAARLAGQKAGTKKAGEKYAADFIAYLPLHVELVSTALWVLRNGTDKERAPFRSLYTRGPVPRKPRKKAPAAT